MPGAVVAIGEAAPPTPGGNVASLSANGQKGRYGVVYLRAICAQAGAPMTETAPDEDVLAADCAVTFPPGDVRIQVKCTSSLTITGTSASWHLKPEWVRKWSDSLVPVYFVLVIVGKQPTQWLQHTQQGTHHDAAAFWCRIRVSDLGRRISVPKNQRLTADTLRTWRDDFVACFTPGGQS